jgi:hypothetical protein
MSGNRSKTGVKASNGVFRNLSVSQLPGLQDRAHGTWACPQESYEHKRQSANDERSCYHKGARLQGTLTAPEGLLRKVEERHTEAAVTSSLLFGGHHAKASPAHAARFSVTQFRLLPTAPIHLVRSTASCSKQAAEKRGGHLAVTLATRAQETLEAGSCSRGPQLRQPAPNPHTRAWSPPEIKTPPPELTSSPLSLRRGGCAGHKRRE